MVENRIHIITGAQGEGKTTLLKNVVEELQHMGIKTGGFIAEGTWKEGQRDGFSLMRLRDRKIFHLSQTDRNEKYFKLKRFWFNPAAVDAGNRELQACLSDDTGIVVIDEIGIFELERKVWYFSFIKLLRNTDKPLVITVREKLKEEVVKKFEMKSYTFYSLEATPASISGKIVNSLKRNKP